MIISKTKGKRILLVHDLCDHNTLDESALDKLSNVLGEHEIEVLTATTAFDAEMMIVADPMIQAILLDWDLAEDNTHQAAKDVLNKLRSRAENVPVFLFADRADVADIPLEVLKETSDFIWLYEDTANFIAGRIEAAIDTYLKNLLPPMFKALAKFSQVHEYSWHTPGHTGGTAFMKALAKICSAAIYRSLSASLVLCLIIPDRSVPVKNMPLKYSALIVPIMLPTVLLPLTE